MEGQRIVLHKLTKNSSGHRKWDPEICNVAEEFCKVATHFFDLPMITLQEQYITQQVGVTNKWQLELQDIILTSHHFLNPI